MCSREEICIKMFIYVSMYSSTHTTSSYPLKWGTKMIGDRDKWRIYKEMVRKALVDGNLGKTETGMLEKLRELMEVPLEMHHDVIGEVMGELEEKRNEKVRGEDPTIQLSNEENFPDGGTGDMDFLYDENEDTGYVLKSKDTGKRVEDWNQYIYRLPAGEEMSDDILERDIPAIGEEFIFYASSTYSRSQRKEINMSVVGVGGAGTCIVGKFLEELKERDRDHSNIIVASVDSNLNDLRQFNNPHRIYIGEDTGGNGTEANLELGRSIGKKHNENYRDIMGDSEVVVVTFGMGGGTGSGAGPEITRAAAGLGKKVISMVTLPFKEEGKRVKDNTALGMKELRDSSDKILAISNDFLRSLDPDLPLIRGFQVMDEIMGLAISRVYELLTTHRDGTFNFFRGGGTLNIFLAQGNSIGGCWRSIKGDLENLFGGSTVREAILYTVFENDLDDIEYAAFRHSVDRELESAEKEIFITSRIPNALAPVEILALVGFYKE